MFRDKKIASFFILIMCLNDAFKPVRSSDITTGIAKFEDAISSADALALDDQLMTVPFSQMEEHLNAAPVCLEILSHLCLVATGKDFPLNDNSTAKIKYLTNPGSFRASISQVAHSGYKAFFEAHSAMFEIKQTTAKVKTHLSRAMNILFGEDVKLFQIERMMPVELYAILDIAEIARERSQGVVDKFKDTENIIQELVKEGIAKEGRSKHQKYWDEINAKIARDKEQRLEASKIELKIRLSKKEKEIDRYQKQFDEALDNLKPDKWAQFGQIALSALSPTLKGLASMAKNSAQRSKGGKNVTNAGDNLLSSILNGLESLSSKGSEFLKQFNSEKDSDAAVDAANDVIENTQDPKKDVITSILDSGMASEIKLLNKQILIMSAYFNDDGTLDSLEVAPAQRKPETVTPDETIRHLQEHKKTIKGYRKKGANEKLADDTVEIIDELIDINEKLQEKAKNGPKTIVKDLQKKFKQQKSALTEIVESKVPMLTKTSPYDGGSKEMRKIKAFSDRKSGDDDKERLTKAQFRLQTLKKQLNLLQEESSNMFKAANENNAELRKTVGKLAQYDASVADLASTLKVLQMGLKELARLKEEWAKLLEFFEEMAITIRTSLSKPLKNFVDQAKILEEESRKGKPIADAISKNLISGIAMEAGKTALVVNRQSSIYHKISQDHLMPQIARLNVLLNLDPETQAHTIRREQLAIGKKTKAIQDAIGNIIDESEKEYKRNIAKRLAELDEAFDVNVRDDQNLLSQSEIDDIKDRVERNAEEFKEEYNVDDILNDYLDDL